MNDIQKIKEKARYLFGPVDMIRNRKGNPGAYILGIRRARPVFEDCPYMTITSWVNYEGEAVFQWGHYDLTEQQMNKYCEEKGS